MKYSLTLAALMSQLVVNAWGSSRKHAPSVPSNQVKVQLAKVVEQKETVFMRCLAAFMNVNRRIMSRNPFDEVLRDYDCMSGPGRSTARGKMWAAFGGKFCIGN
jgi:hypothetical protein